MKLSLSLLLLRFFPVLLPVPKIICSRSHLKPHLCETKDGFTLWIYSQDLGHQPVLWPLQWLHLWSLVIANCLRHLLSLEAFSPHLPQQTVWFPRKMVLWRLECNPPNHCFPKYFTNHEVICLSKSAVDNSLPRGICKRHFVNESHVSSMKHRDSPVLLLLYTNCYWLSNSYKEKLH